MSSYVFSSETKIYRTNYHVIFERNTLIFETNETKKIIKYIIPKPNNNDNHFDSNGVMRRNYPDHFHQSIEVLGMDQRQHVRDLNDKKILIDF